MVLAACSSGGGGGDRGRDETRSMPITTTTVAPKTVGGVVADVDPTRLESTLRAVVGERVTNEQRAATRATLRRELEAAGLAVTEQPFGDDGVNLFGRLGPDRPGTPLVLVSAHYDTVAGSPGADDNGSGVAAVVELGRALAGAEIQGRVLLAFFDLEERGLLGSRHFVADRGPDPGGPDGGLQPRHGRLRL